MSDILTDDELAAIPAPTAAEVLAVVDEEFGGDRSELNRIAAITIVWQRKTAAAQHKKDMEDRQDPELREKIGRLLWMDGDSSDNGWENTLMRQTLLRQADAIIALRPTEAQIRADERRKVVRQKNEEINRHEIYWRDAMDKANAEIRAEERREVLKELREKWASDKAQGRSVFAIHLEDWERFARAAGITDNWWELKDSPEVDDG